MQKTPLWFLGLVAVSSCIPRAKPGPCAQSSCMSATSLQSTIRLNVQPKRHVWNRTVDTGAKKSKKIYEHKKTLLKSTWDLFLRPRNFPKSTWKINNIFPFAPVTFLESKASLWDRRRGRIEERKTKAQEEPNGTPQGEEFFLTGR